MTSYPKITVVTQCFNRESTIAETIESVLGQSYPNLEYIVIDDGSSDTSWDIIQTFKDRLTHIERLEGCRNTPVPAINYGFSLATGEILMWLNAKNVLIQKSLFTIADVFSTYPEVEWVTGIALGIDEEGKILRLSPERYDFYDYLIDNRVNIQQESTFFRKTLWDRCGGSIPEAYPNAFDAGLWCTKFFFEAPLYHLNTLVGAYRKSSKALSVARREEFSRYTKQAHEEMRHLAKTPRVLVGRLYQLLKIAGPILRIIPDNVYQYIPLLRHFSHRAIEYRSFKNDLGVLQIYKRNPFRTIFPR